MSPDDFDDLIQRVLAEFIDASQIIKESIGVLDFYSRALRNGVSSAISSLTAITLYNQLHILVMQLDETVSSLNLVLDMIQDTINNYPDGVDVVLHDEFKSVNSEINNYIFNVQKFVEDFRDFENGLLLKGYIDDIAGSFSCESIHL